MHRVLVILSLIAAAASVTNAYVCHQSYTFGTGIAETTVASEIGGCTNITGSIALTSTNLLTLSVFDSVVAIGGSLTVSSNALLTSIGMPSLAHLGGALVIDANSQLQTIHMDALVGVQGSVSVANNAALASIAWTHLVKIEGADLSIRQNAQLITVGASNSVFSSLGQLSSGPGTYVDLEISDNSALSALGLFNQSTPIAFPSSRPLRLRLQNYNVAPNMKAFSGLSGALHSLEIIKCNALQTLDGLNSFTEVIVGIHVEDNPVLTNVDGLNFIAVTNASALEYITFKKLPLLVDIDGLNNWPNTPTSHPQFTLELSDLDILTSIDPLSFLDNAVLFSLRLINLPLLNKLEGLEGLTHIIAEFSLDNVDTIDTVNDLDTDITLGTSCVVTIANNEVLRNMRRFDSVLTISTLLISDNPALLRIPGFESLQTITSSFIFNNNDEQDSFSDSLGFQALTTVGGSFTISNNAKIEHLDAFASLTTIGGSLSIKANALLDDISGLAAVTSVGGLLELYNLPALEELDGAFANLVSCTKLRINTCNLLTNFDSFMSGISVAVSLSGFLEMMALPQLTSLNGLRWIKSASSVTLTSLGSSTAFAFGSQTLEHLETVSGSFIVQNTGLTDIDSLGALASSGLTVSGDFRLVSNPFFTSTTGLSALSSVGGELLIDGNDALVDFDDITNLSLTVAELGVEDNALLKNLNGLSGINVNTKIDIRRNDALVSIAGLSSVSGTLFSIYIDKNDALLSLEGLQGVSGISSAVTITDNAQLVHGLASSTFTNTGECVFSHLNEALSSSINIDIEDNANLDSIDCFHRVKNAQTVTVKNNNAVTSLNMFTISSESSSSITIANLPSLLIMTIGRFSAPFWINGHLTVNHLPLLTGGAGVLSSKVSGDVTIHDLDTLPFLNLLPTATEADHILVYNLPACGGVTGLHALTSVKSFTLKHCANMTWIQLPANQATVEGDIVFEDLPSATSVNAFLGTPTVQTIKILNCYSLVNATLASTAVSANTVLATNNTVLERLHLFESVPASTGFTIGTLLYFDSMPNLFDVGSLFQRVVSVTGSLYIADTKISSMDFDALTSVGDILGFRLNSAVAKIELPLLTSIGGFFEIGHNAALVSIAMPVLSVIAKDLLVRHNPLLESFNMTSATVSIAASPDQPSAVTSCLEEYYSADYNPSYFCRPDGSILFLANPLLHDFRLGPDYSSTAVTIPGSVLILDTQTTSLRGLGFISSIHGGIVIARNPQLLSFVGMQYLTSVTGPIDLRNNTRACANSIPFTVFAGQWTSDSGGFASANDTRCLAWEVYHVASPVTTFTQEILSSVLPSIFALTSNGEWLTFGEDLPFIGPTFLDALLGSQDPAELASVDEWSLVLGSLDNMMDDLKLLSTYSTVSYLDTLTSMSERIIQASIALATTAELVVCAPSVGTLYPGYEVDANNVPIDSSRNLVVGASLFDPLVLSVDSQPRYMGVEVQMSLLAGPAPPSGCSHRSVVFMKENTLTTTQSNQTVISPVVQLSVRSDSPANPLTRFEGAMAYFYHQPALTKGSVCAVHDTTNQIWDTTACVTVSANVTLTVCRCTIYYNKALTLALLQANNPSALIEAALTGNVTVASEEAAQETAASLNTLANGNAWLNSTSTQNGGGAKTVAKAVVNVLKSMMTWSLTNGMSSESQTSTLNALNGLFSPQSLAVMKDAGESDNLVGVVENVGFSLLVGLPCGSQSAPAVDAFSLLAASQAAPSGTLGTGNVSFTLPAAFAAALPAAACHAMSLVEYTDNPFVSSDSAQTADSSVVSFSVQDTVVSGLDDDASVVFTLQRLNASADTVETVCAFWNTATSMWSTDGCVTVSRNDSSTTCKCNHLTNFALIFDARGSVPADGGALEVLTYIACVSSMLCCLLFVIVFAYLEKLRSGPILLTMQLCVVLFLTNLVFLVGVDKTANAAACTAVAFLLYYLLLVSFMWMACLGHRLFVMLVRAELQSKNTDMGALRRYAFYAWGLPLVLVIICLIVEFTTDNAIGFGSSKSCWISTTNGLVGAFLVPVAIIMIFNISVMVLVVRALLASQANNRSQKGAQTHKDRIRQLVVYAGLLVSLGLTWLFGFLAIATNEIVFWYLFVIFNGGQGVLLAFVYVFRSRVLKAYRDKRAATQRKIQIASNQSAGTASTGFSDSSPHVGRRVRRALNTILRPADRGEKYSVEREAVREQQEMIALDTRLSPSLNNLRTVARAQSLRRHVKGSTSTAPGASATSLASVSSIGDDSLFSPSTSRGRLSRGDTASGFQVTESMMEDVEGNMSMYMDREEEPVYLDSQVAHGDEDDEQESVDDFGSPIGSPTPFLKAMDWSQGVSFRHAPNSSTGSVRPNGRRKRPSEMSMHSQGAATTTANACPRGSTDRLSVADFVDDEVMIDMDSEGVEGNTATDMPEAAKSEVSRRRASLV